MNKDRFFRKPKRHIFSLEEDKMRISLTSIAQKKRCAILDYNYNFGSIVLVVSRDNLLYRFIRDNREGFITCEICEDQPNRMWHETNLQLRGIKEKSNFCTIVEAVLDHGA